MSKASGQPSPKKVEVCPHCGTQLSPWQQVLLSVDRALMCKNCWYRIVLDAADEAQKDKQDDSSNAKDVKQ